MTNEFAIKCSMTGRGKEVTTAVGDSLLIKTIKSNNITK